MTTTLYHFTSIANWEQIRRAGYLAPTESHVHPRKPGPPVVWLTTRNQPGGLGLEQSATVRMLSDWERIDKERVRITVEVSKTLCPRWYEWAPKHGGDPAWLAHVRSTIPHAGSWRVCPRPILRQHWLSCHDLSTGRAVSIAPTLQQMGFKRLYAGQKA